MTAATVGTRAPAPPAVGSLPAELLRHARERPDDVALREKWRGRWRETTWAQYAQRAAHIGLALAELGVVPGDRVAVQAENRPEWVLADLAVQGLGAVTVGIYPTSPAAEVEYLLEHSESVVLVAEDEEQLDKALAVRERLPALRHVVVVDPRNVGALDDPMLLTWEQLEERGAQAGGGADEWARRVAALDPSEPAIVVYTSGTTGPPKGALISHANLLWAATRFREAFDARPDDEVLSYLPLCHVAERLGSVINAVATGYVVNFGEGGESFPNDLREVQPTLFLAVPRVWEKLRAATEQRLEGAGRLKRWCGRRFRAGLDRVPSPLGALLLTRPACRQLGFGRVRVTLASAAPMDTDVVEFFAGFGLRIREGYGLTEAGGLGTWTPSDAIRPGRVGRAPAPVELRIAADGEILLRGPAGFVGYLDDDAATRAVVDAEGWIHSGDLGELDVDGFLAITGRTKGLVITSAGTQVSPEHLERRLEESPYVRDAVVVGDRRPWLSALIGVEPETTGEWAARGGLPVLGYRDLSERPEVRDLIADVVERVNDDLADGERIATFVLLPERLDESGGLLTATHRVRRAAVMQRFTETIDRMYVEGDR
jgi:long-chain acyl-CoA synthetase